MKRLQMLLVPLFAMPFLTGCKFGNLDDMHALTFEFTNCQMKDEKGEIHGDEYSIITSVKTINFTLIAVPEDYEFPEGSVQFIDVNTNEPFAGEHSFSSNDGKASVKLTADVKVIATAQQPIVPPNA